MIKGSPNLFEYEDYRQFLKDFFIQKKKRFSGYSYRVFAKKADLSSSGYVSMVIRGLRNMTRKTIVKFIKGLELSKNEADFFENLVLFNQAQSLAEKDLYFSKMRKNAKYRRLKPLEYKQFEVLRKWYYVAVRELVALPGFKENPIWISKMLYGYLTPKEAKATLKVLEDIELIKRGVDGVFQQVDPIITSGDEAISLLSAKFHEEMMGRAMKSIEEVAAKKRDISSVTLTISHAKFQELKSEIQEFRKKLLNMAQNSTDKHDQVIQLNMQLFPLSNFRDE